MVAPRLFGRDGRISLKMHGKQGVQKSDKFVGFSHKIEQNCCILDLQQTFVSFRSRHNVLAYKQKMGMDNCGMLVAKDTEMP